MRRSLRIFSIVYNEPYLDWFERGCIHSLLWPKNRAALATADGWDIWTTPEDEARVRRAAGRVPLELRIGIFNSHAPEDGTARKENLKRALISEIHETRDKGAFLWIAPDSIFGDGSLGSIIELGSVPGLCIAMAPMRVIADGFIEAMGNVPLSNAELVRLSFERMHRGFAEAEATRRHTNSYESGVSWRRLGDGLYAITHRKHSAYLMQPTRGDAEWFKHMNKFGAYDHSFPRLLVQSERQRVIGSSDAAFVAELTPELGHAPPCLPTDPNEPDRFMQKQPHHAVNRNVVCIWRSA
jgi:hypothetical protein